MKEHRNKFNLMISSVVLLLAVLACIDPGVIAELGSQMATLEAFEAQIGEMLTPVSDFSVAPGEKARQVVFNWSHPMGEELDYEIYILDEPISDENWRSINVVPMDDGDITFETEGGLERMSYTWDGLPLRRKYWFVVRQTLRQLEDLGNAIEFLGPVLGIELPEHLWTIPPSEFSPSNMVSVIDSGFRPDPDGYQFENSSPGRFTPSVSKDNYIEVLRLVYGDDAVCVKVDERGNCKAKKSAKRYARRSIKKGQCFGFTTTSGLFYLDRFDQRDYAGFSIFPTNETIQIQQNDEINRFIMSYQLIQNSNDILSKLIDTGNSGLMENISDLENLMKNASSVPNIGITNDKRKCGGHSVLPFFVSSEDGFMVKIWVYDNNSARDETRFIEVNTIENNWIYQFSPSEIWKGINDENREICGKLAFADVGQFGSVESGHYQGETPWESSYFTVVTNSITDLFIFSESGGQLGVDPSGDFSNNISDSMINIIDETGTTYIKLPFNTYRYLVTDQSSGDSDFLVMGSNHTYEFESLSAGDQFTISPDIIKFVNENLAASPKISVAIEDDSKSALISYQAMVTATDKIEINYQRDPIEILNNSSETHSVNMEIDYTSLEEDYHFQSDNISHGSNENLVIQPEEYSSEEETFYLDIDSNSDGTIDQTIPLENDYVPDEEEAQTRRGTLGCPSVLFIGGFLLIFVMVIVLISKKRKNDKQQEYQDNDFFDF